MNEGVEAVTTRALALALDAATLRHQVTAANIANVQTAGYVAQRLSFEDQMAEAARDLASRGAIDSRVLDNVHMRLHPNLDAEGRPLPVQLDAEMVELSRNAVHYQALVKGLTRHLAVLHAAAADGRR
jgi:flagellar basal-body rod protein FlgB